LRKQTRDGASWTLRYHFVGRDHWMTLGNYPDMSLAQARIDVRAARVQIDRHQNPLALRREALAKERQRGAFKTLCEDWYRSEIQGRRLKYPDVPKRYLDKYLLPKLGRYPACEVTAGDVAHLLDELKVRAPTSANDLLRFTRRIFAFGVRRGLVMSNPVADFSPRLDGGGTEKPRSRALSTDELARLCEKIRETSFGESNLLTIRLLLALCARKTELLAARWAEFNLEVSPSTESVWRLPGDRTKTGESLDMPLVPEVVSWLLRLRELCGAYDRYDYFQERRTALGQWTQLIVEAEAGRTTVTPIRRGHN
jgi:integrase